MWPYFENHQGGPGHWKLVSRTKALCKSTGWTLPETCDYSAKQSYYPWCTVSSHSQKGHQGITKVKQHLRQSVWWPGRHLSWEIRTWMPWLANRGPHTSSRAPPNDRSTKTSMVQCHIDYCGPFPSREYHFVAVDETSKYPEVHVTH